MRLYLLAEREPVCFVSLFQNKINGYGMLIAVGGDK
jgi:hypothetical protein